MDQSYDKTIIGHIYHEILHSIVMIEILNNTQLSELNDLLASLKDSEQDDHTTRRIIDRYQAKIREEAKRFDSLPGR